MINVSDMQVERKDNEIVVFSCPVLSFPVEQTASMMEMGHTLLADGKNGEKLSAGKNVSAFFGPEYAVWVNGYSHLFEVSDEAARFFCNLVTPGSLLAAHDRLCEEL